MTNKYSSLIGAVLLLSAATLPAAVIPNVSIQAVSSFYSNGTTDQRSATNLVNGSGLFGFAQTPNITGAGWLTSDTSSPAAISNAYVIFDLGAVHNLSQIKVYNYDEGIPSATGISNGVKAADFQFGTTPGVFTSSLANVSFSIAPGGSSTTPNLRDFSQIINAGGVSARYIAITNVQTNWGGGSVASNALKVGLSKVLFIDTNVSATLSLVTMGFASNSITVWFSEPVTPATATNLANYAIVSTGSDVPAISGATLGLFNDYVILSTTTLTSPLASYTLSITNVAAASDGTLIAVSTPIQSQLAFWLKADAGITLNGSTVSAWADQSGNGNNAVMSTNTTQPTFVASDIGGLPTVKFGSGHYLEVPFSATMALMHDYSVVAVERLTTAPSSSNGELLSRAAVNRAAPFDYRIVAANVVMYRGNQGGGSTADNVASTTSPGTNTSLAECVVNGSTCTHYLNGLLNGSGPELTGFLDSQATTSIASRADRAVNFAGNISEIMLFRGALSTADRLAVNAYLGAKYSLALTDLAFSSVPTNISAPEGLTATFSGAAVASSTNVIAYQWQTNGVNIAGATKTSYTTPTLALTNSGTLYTLVATSGSTVITSAPPATLTVTVDSTAPTVSYAGEQFWNRSNIVVVYSEPVDPMTATTLGNYALVDAPSNPILVNSASMGDLPNKVVLSVSSTNGYLLSVANVQDLFSNSIVPVQVTVGVYPSMVLWLRADAGVTADASGNVTEWDDQSGNANDVFGAGAPFSPVLTNGFNGQTALYYNGSNYLYNSAGPGTSLGITNDMAVESVVQFAPYTTPGGYEIVCRAAGTANNIAAPYDYYAETSDGRLRFYRGNGGTQGNLISYGSDVSTRGPAPNVPHVLTATMTGPTASQFLDGAANGSGQITVPFVDQSGFFGVGARADFFSTAASPAMSGYIAEIMMFNVGLSTADRAQFESYLGNKYSIAITGPASPTLSIAAVGTNSFLISWATPVFAYALQHTSSLASPAWSAVTNNVTTANGTNSVTIGLAGTSQFFRLQKQ